VRRLGTAPDGSRFKVTLDGAVVPFAEGETDDSFDVLVEFGFPGDAQVETPAFLAGDDAEAEDGPSKAAAIAFGVGSEAATDRISEAFAIVAEQNARNKIRIQKEMADEAALALASASK